MAAPESPRSKAQAPERNPGCALTPIEQREDWESLLNRLEYLSGVIEDESASLEEVARCYQEMLAVNKRLRPLFESQGQTCILKDGVLAPFDEKLAR